MTQELIWLAMTGKMPCMFHAMTGLYCPGCGGTRAVKALLRGDVWLSFCYHPLVPYMALVGVIFLVSYAIYLKTGKEQFHLYLGNSWIYVGLALIVLNFVVKNFLLIGCGIDVLEMLTT